MERRAAAVKVLEVGKSRLRDGLEVSPMTSDIGWDAVPWLHNRHDVSDRKVYMIKTVLISKFVLVSAVATALCTSALPSIAQAGPVQNRFNRQQARINQGVRSGQLTQREYNSDETRLQRDEWARNRDLRRNDGHLTRQERANLNRRLNNNSRDIYFTKHNRADQPGV